MAASGFSDGVLVAADDGAEEAFDQIALLLHAVLAGDEDELVVGGDAVVLDVEHVDGVAEHLALDGLDVPVGADGRVDLSGVQRRPQVEADVDELHGVETALDAGAAEDGLEVDLVAGDAGVADALAGELGGVGDARRFEGLNGVERDVDDRADGGDGDAFGLGQNHVGLVADGEVDGVPGDELGRVFGVAAELELDVQPFVLEEALGQSGVESRVVGVGEPVEGDREPVGVVLAACGGEERHGGQNARRGEQPPLPGNPPAKVGEVHGSSCGLVVRRCDCSARWAQGVAPSARRVRRHRRARFP